MQKVLDSSGDDDYVESKSGFHEDSKQGTKSKALDTGIPASNTAEIKVFRYQFAVTITLVLAWLINGLQSSLQGTCLPDQRDRLGVSTQDMSTLFSALSIVSVLGGILFSLGADMWKHYAILIMSVNISISAVILVGVRFLTDYTWFFVLNIIMTFLYLPVDLIGNAVILRTWGERATGPTYAIHFGFGLGAMIGPFIARPFLSPDEVTNSTNSAEMNKTVTSWYSFPEGSRIEIPYIIIGVIFFIVGICLLVLHTIGPPADLKERMNAMSAETQAMKTVCHPKSCSNGSIPFTVFFLIMFLLFYLWNCGREVGLGVYLVTFATESDLQFSKEWAATFNGIYSGSIMAGRLVSIVVSRWLSIQLLTAVEIVVILLLYIGLTVWGTYSPVAFMFLTCGIGFFGSPLWPGLIAWTDRYITVTSTAVLLVHSGAGTGNLIFNMLYGALLEKKHYQGFLYLASFPAAVIFIQFIIMQIVARKQGSRFKPAVKRIDEDSYPLLYNESAED